VKGYGKMQQRPAAEPPNQTDRARGRGKWLIFSSSREALLLLSIAVVGMLIAWLVPAIQRGCAPSGEL